MLQDYVSANKTLKLSQNVTINIPFRRENMCARNRGNRRRRRDLTHVGALYTRQYEDRERERHRDRQTDRQRDREEKEEVIWTQAPADVYYNVNTTSRSFAANAFSTVEACFIRSCRHVWMFFARFTTCLSVLTSLPTSISSRSTPRRHLALVSTMLMQAVDVVVFTRASAF